MPAAFAGERGKQRVRHANEFHALIVMVGKEHCGTAAAVCGVSAGVLPCSVAAALRKQHLHIACTG
jgi:hypothetical protein